MDAERLDKEIQERGFLAVGRDVQLAWVTTLGWTRTYFLVHVALVFLVTPITYRIGYETDFGEKLAVALSTPGLPMLSMLLGGMLQLFYWMCLAMPPAAIVAFMVFVLTGMFQKRFWDEVAQLREETTAEHLNSSELKE